MCENFDPGSEATPRRLPLNARNGGAPTPLHDARDSPLSHQFIHKCCNARNEPQMNHTAYRTPSASSSTHALRRVEQLVVVILLFVIVDVAMPPHAATRGCDGAVVVVILLLLVVIVQARPPHAAARGRDGAERSGAGRDRVIVILVVDVRAAR